MNMEKIPPGFLINGISESNSGQVTIFLSDLQEKNIKNFHFCPSTTSISSGVSP